MSEPMKPYTREELEKAVVVLAFDIGDHHRRCASNDALPCDCAKGELIEAGECLVATARLAFAAPAPSEPSEWEIGYQAGYKAALRAPAPSEDTQPVSEAELAAALWTWNDHHDTHGAAMRQVLEDFLAARRGESQP